MRAATSTTAIARGSTVHATRAFINEAYGATTLAAIVAKLGAKVREQIASAKMTDELPYDAVLALWRAADAALASRDPKWMEAAGAFAIDGVGQQLYGGLLRKSSPAEFLTQSVSLFQLYYGPGDMVLVEADASRAVLRLIGFPSADVLFCRRQTGGLRRAAELAGGREVRVAHVRCEHEGDAFCEWEVRWSRSGS